MCFHGLYISFHLSKASNYRLIKLFLDTCRESVHTLMRLARACKLWAGALVLFLYPQRFRLMRLNLPGDILRSGADSVTDRSHAAPQYCEVTAASYLIQHAAIYANDDDYERYIEPFLKKLNSTSASTLFGKKQKGWAGPLSSRYPKLIPTTKRIYADKKARTKDTAAAFVKVFPQEVEIVEVNLNRSSFNAQDPHKACKAFSKKPGNDELQNFMSIAPRSTAFHSYRPRPLQLLECLRGGIPH